MRQWTLECEILYCCAP